MNFFRKLIARARLNRAAFVKLGGGYAAALKTYTEVLPQLKQFGAPVVDYTRPWSSARAFVNQHQAK